MGLDVYVGSLTRYYSGDWETVLQKHARETGTPLRVVRQDEGDDVITDPEVIRAAVLQWRENLSAGLGDNLSEPLDWDESPGSRYFTDKPAWDCYGSLILWAAYLDHPDLVRPEACVENWSEDEAFKRSSADGFQTEFPTLLRNTEIWLPVSFRFTFAGPDVGGNVVNFGSAVTLRDELTNLNTRTWGADKERLASWRQEGATRSAPLEVGARFAFSIFYELANAAVENRLVMKLDY